MWRSHAPQVSPTLAEVLDKAIEYHPRDRYPSAREMLSALQQPKSQPVGQGASTMVSLTSNLTSDFLLSSLQKKEWRNAAITGSIIGAFVIIGLSIAQPNLVPFAENSSKQPVTQPSRSQNQTDEYFWLAARRVTDADLVGKTAFEIDIMRNEIFARHGRRFNAPALPSYFNSQPWYRQIYEPDIFPNSLLSNLEKENAQYILDFQQRNGLK
jgi:serine/threonine-protein kinase